MTGGVSACHNHLRYDIVHFLLYGRVRESCVSHIHVWSHLNTEDGGGRSPETLLFVW